MRVPLAGLPLKRRVALVVSSAVGFALGGAVVGAASIFAMTIVAFAVLGGLGGYALGWAAPGGPQRMILAGFLGFLAGFTVPLYLVSVYGDPVGSFWLVGLAGGGVGGGALGYAWSGWRSAGRIAAGSAVSWAIGFGLVEAVRGLGYAPLTDTVAQGAYAALVFGLAGLVGGLGVGAGAAWADADRR